MRPRQQQTTRSMVCHLPMLKECLPIRLLRTKRTQTLRARKDLSRWDSEALVRFWLSSTRHVAMIFVSFLRDRLHDER